MTTVQLFADIPVDQLHLDVYAPDKRAQKPVAGYPVVYFIHGGAWLSGSKDSCREQCRTFAEHGYVAVAPNFALSSVDFYQAALLVNLMAALMVAYTLVSDRREDTALFLLLALVAVCFVYVLGSLPATTDSSQVRHPAHVQDLAKGLKWVHDSIDEFGGNPQLIHLVGHSAGGHLAALLSTNFVFLEQAGLPANTIKSCTGISGVYSDKRLQETKVGRELIRTAFGNYQTYYDAFPIYHANVNTPPFLLLNAEYDISLKSHSYDFHYTLREAGVYVRTAYFPELTHFSIVQQWHAENRSVFQTIHQFLQQINQVCLSHADSPPWLRSVL